MEAPEYILDEASKTDVLDYINFSETGVIRRDMDYPQFVESSVSLGVVSVKKSVAEIWIMTRSSKTTQFEMMYQKIVRLTERFGGTYEVMSNCPAWEYDADSRLKEIFENVYRDMYGKEPSFMILHAGVEPSEFAKNIDRKLDMIRCV